jgi:hypothetical protein
VEQIIATKEGKNYNILGTNHEYRGGRGTNHKYRGGHGTNQDYMENKNLVRRTNNSYKRRNKHTISAEQIMIIEEAAEQIKTIWETKI